MKVLVIDKLPEAALAALGGLGLTVEYLPETKADGLPGVSEDTARRVLREAGRRWQRDRSWCETGVAVRQRKTGPVTVTDPDAAPKNS